jgi:hypothetical protein
MFRLLMSENAVICTAAVAASLLLTTAVLRFLAPAIEEQMGRPAPGGTTAIALDSAVFIITGIVGILIALSLPIIPALTARSPAAARARRDGRT